MDDENQNQNETYNSVSLAQQNHENRAMRLMEILRLEVASTITSTLDILDLEHHITNRIENIMKKELQLCENTTEYKQFRQYIDNLHLNK